MFFGVLCGKNDSLDLYCYEFYKIRIVIETTGDGTHIINEEERLGEYGCRI